jgi:glycerophosphoryl diester phosphodiesterase
VAPHYRLLKLGFLWRMKLLQTDVYVWTVNDERRLFKLIGNKYITAIITDRPELALQILHSQLVGMGGVGRIDKSKIQNTPRSPLS